MARMGHDVKWRKRQHGHRHAHGRSGAQAQASAALSPSTWTCSSFNCTAAIGDGASVIRSCALVVLGNAITRSEEHTSELQSLMRISYAVFCLKKKIN